jgi:hypothetical protein
VTHVGLLEGAALTFVTDARSRPTIYEAGVNAKRARCVAPSNALN